MPCRHGVVTTNHSVTVAAFLSTTVEAAETPEFSHLALCDWDYFLVSNAQQVSVLSGLIEEGDGDEPRVQVPLD